MYKVGTTRLPKRDTILTYTDFSLYIIITYIHLEGIFYKSQNNVSIYKFVYTVWKMHKMKNISNNTSLYTFMYAITPFT